MTSSDRRFQEKKSPPQGKLRNLRQFPGGVLRLLPAQITQFSVYATRPLLAHTCSIPTRRRLACFGFSISSSSSVSSPPFPLTAPSPALFCPLFCFCPSSFSDRVVGGGAGGGNLYSSLVSAATQPSASPAPARRTTSLPPLSAFHSKRRLRRARCWVGRAAQRSCRWASGIPPSPLVVFCPRCIIRDEGRRYLGVRHVMGCLFPFAENTSIPIILLLL